MKSIKLIKSYYGMESTNLKNFVFSKMKQFKITKNYYKRTIEENNIKLSVEVSIHSLLIVLITIINLQTFETEFHLLL